MLRAGAVLDVPHAQPDGLLGEADGVVVEGYQSRNHFAELDREDLLRLVENRAHIGGELEEHVEKEFAKFVAGAVVHGHIPRLRQDGCLIAGLLQGHDERLRDPSPQPLPSSTHLRSELSLHRLVKCVHERLPEPGEVLGLYALLDVHGRERLELLVHARWVVRRRHDRVQDLPKLGPQRLGARSEHVRELLAPVEKGSVEGGANLRTGVHRKDQLPRQFDLGDVCVCLPFTEGDVALGSPLDPPRLLPVLGARIGPPPGPGRPGPPPSSGARRPRAPR
mmetsp:Transcript_33666/g.78600  ORF Transcript_33666/g.78600 Transcript_33666/m.78600 type:complete len:279 (-) Transcript_33666:588-1424(-)